LAVYLFTYHAYRSWNADHRRGYTSKDEGVLPPDQKKADFYDRNAKQPAVEFDRVMQAVLIAGAADVCRRRDWRFHAGGTDPTHGHFLISWKEFTPWNDVSDKLKNLLSLFLGRLAKETGRRWFGAQQSRKRVTTREHFDYLVTRYLPDQRGLSWTEGETLPEIPDGIL
jgi:hypothetical protein